MELTSQIKNMMFDKAKSVFSNPYNPYSNFAVAASILCKDGSIYVGVNMENASYGLTICAERIAAGTAITNGCTEMIAVLIITKNGETPPCGACRQVLAEFNPQMTVLLASPEKITLETSMDVLLPSAFLPENLQD